MDELKPLSPSPTPLGDDLISAYLANEASAAERMAVETWASENAEQRAYLESLQKTWHLAATQPGTQRAPLAVQRFKDALASEPALVPEKQSKSPRSITSRYNQPRRGLLTFAAIACLAIVAIAIPDVRSLIISSVNETGSVTYATERGERTTIQLPDGSQVVLAPETRVRYTEQPNGNRVVELDGQAYFTVTHNPAKSFIVQASATETRVLGTSFVVRAYATDRAPQVAVTEGKVAVANATTTKTLLPGDVASVPAKDEITIANNVTITDVVGWMRGQLVFDGVPLRDVVTELERTYNIDITLEGKSLGDQLITMSFTSQSTNDVLNSLAFIANATLTQRGNHAILAPKS